MFWRASIPERTLRDAGGKNTLITVIAGHYADVTPNAPPRKSWASRGDAHVAI